MNLLAVHNVSVRYHDRTVVDHVDFTVDRGDVVAIIGPNGSGKTTLLKAVLGVVTPSEGAVHWHGSPRIGYVPQRVDLERGFPMTVEELLLLKLTDRPFWRHDRATHGRVSAELARVGADKLIEKRVSELSGGELQRVLIAFALVDRPDVLCLDEPSSGIDVEGEETIYNLIHRLAEQDKLTVLLVSHDLDIVFKYATKVICINRKLMCAGVPSRVLTPEMIQRAYSGASTYKHEHGPRSSHAH
ncbi:metal ABC transporter ATP-binding protein [Patescibacteria group bacterium]|nr:MAG: metal ABC transporter ATP-binding protein [Patescibacteria group bacterium]